MFFSTLIQRMKSSLIYIIFFFFLSSIKYTQGKIILDEVTIQINVSEGMHAMYNSQFDKAYSIFEKLRLQYPEHPIAYFLLSLNTWWKIAPCIENTFYDQIFLQYLKKTIYTAKKLYKKNKDNYEASFFLSAAYAFKGRLYGERDQWIKAALAGKKALQYHKKTIKKQHLSTELLFGEALYHYYNAWVYNHYAIFRWMKIFTPQEDFVTGIQQLKQVAQNAFYTRTEAQYYLLGILVDDLQNYEEALPLAHYLHQTYPNNSCFEKYYAKILYMVGDFEEAQKISYAILQKVDKHYIGYGPKIQRCAYFFLGHIYQLAKNWEKAQYFYEKIKKFTEDNQKQYPKHGYYLYALLGLAVIAEQKEKWTQAYHHYQKAYKYAKEQNDLQKKIKNNMQLVKKKINQNKKYGHQNH